MTVVLPCLLRLLTGRLLSRGGGLLTPVLPLVRVAHLVAVVTLSYTNACGALQQVVSRPDPDFLLLRVLPPARTTGPESHSTDQPTAVSGSSADAG
ncbi:hypothetical protein [Streptacidiphilus sp. PAMC 29251]